MNTDLVWGLLDALGDPWSEIDVQRPSEEVYERLISGVLGTPFREQDALVKLLDHRLGTTIFCQGCGEIFIITSICSPNPIQLHFPDTTDENPFSIADLIRGSLESLSKTDEYGEPF